MKQLSRTSPLRHLTACLFAVLLAAVLFTGCGGGNEAPGGNDSDLTTDQLTFTDCTSEHYTTLTNSRFNDFWVVTRCVRITNNSSSDAELSGFLTLKQYKALEAPFFNKQLEYNPSNDQNIFVRMSAREKATYSFFHEKGYLCDTIQTNIPDSTCIVNYLHDADHNGTLAPGQSVEVKVDVYLPEAADLQAAYKGQEMFTVSAADMLEHASAAGTEWYYTDQPDYIMDPADVHYQKDTLNGQYGDLIYTHFMLTNTTRDSVDPGNTLLGLNIETENLTDLTAEKASLGVKTNDLKVVVTTKKGLTYNKDLPVVAARQHTYGSAIASGDWDNVYLFCFVPMNTDDVWTSIEYWYKGEKLTHVDNLAVDEDTTTNNINNDTPFKALANCNTDAEKLANTAQYKGLQFQLTGYINVPTDDEEYDYFIAYLYAHNYSDMKLPLEHGNQPLGTYPDMVTSQAFASKYIQLNKDYPFCVFSNYENQMTYMPANASVLGHSATIAIVIAVPHGEKWDSIELTYTLPVEDGSHWAKFVLAEDSNLNPGTGGLSEVVDVTDERLAWTYRKRLTEEQLNTSTLLAEQVTVLNISEADNLTLELKTEAELLAEVESYKPNLRASLESDGYTGDELEARVNEMAWQTAMPPVYSIQARVNGQNYPVLAVVPEDSSTDKLRAGASTQLVLYTVLPESAQGEAVEYHIGDTILRTGTSAVQALLSGFIQMLRGAK